MKDNNCTRLSRFVSAAEAIAAVRPSDNVFVGIHEPKLLVDTLVEDKERLTGLRMLVALVTGEPAFLQPGVEDYFNIVSLLSRPKLSKAFTEGRLAYLPCHQSHVPRLASLEEYTPMVVFMHIAPPDEQGYCSFGTTLDYGWDFNDTARLVIAEINDQMPRTISPIKIHISNIDYLVRSSRPLDTSPPANIKPVEKDIAGNIASLIPDGANISTGIGAIPDALCSQLGGKKNLGIHTTMFGDRMMELMQAGVVTNENKTDHQGKAVIARILGSPELYRWVSSNPQVEVHPVSYVGDPCVIGTVDNFIAVNSGIEVDLSGQINAEVQDGVIIGAVGGQVDFFRGAMRSKGGKAIFALRSKTRNGGSAIVANLSQGAPVTTSRSDIDYVVTEYGIARIWGNSLSNRAKALINIAHPDFRQDLLRMVA
ncbi:acetyl-CoA hydrolase/transferase family protein [Chloroflexota bacterium]